MTEKEPSSTSRSSLSPLALLGILAFGFILVHKMTKKWKKPGNDGNATRNDPKPAEGCRYNPASVQSVSIKEYPEHEQWKTDQKTFWRKQLSHSRRSNIITAIGVFFTGIAAVGAVVYALITYNQWQDANRNFRLDERPWIGLVETKLDGEMHEGENTGHVTFKNVGKSPGFLTITWSDSAVTTDLPKDAWDRLPESIYEQREPSFPGDTFSLPVRTRAIPKPLLDLINNGERKVCIFGRIRYTDNFKPEITHTTQFCEYYIPNSSGSGFRPCPGKTNAN